MFGSEHERLMTIVWSLNLNIELQKTIRPDRRLENASLRGTGIEIPLRLQNADHGTRAKPR